jgi:hypothetical protein
MNDEPLYYLTILNHWNGEPCATSRPVDIHLVIKKDSLGIRLISPFYDNPAPPQSENRCKGLWNYEVVELFVAGPETDYLEIELNPHGHYLVLSMNGIRQPSSETLLIDYNAEIKGNTWVGEAVIPIHLLPREPRRINAFAIHDVEGGRRYLASTPVPGEAPDFHQPKTFPPMHRARTSFQR